MLEGSVAVARSAEDAGFLRVRLWPLAPSVQLLRRAVADVLGIELAESVPLVVVSPDDGVSSLPPARRRLDFHLRVPLAALFLDVPQGVSGDDPGHLIATVSSVDPAAERLHQLRRGWGADGSGVPWMRLTDTAEPSAAARRGLFGPRLAGTSFADGRLVFGGLDVDRAVSS